MEIKKTSEKYNFYKEDKDYVLDLGRIKRGENTKTDLLITGLEDSSLFEIKAVCGCTSTDKEIVDKSTQKVSITYNQCDSSFAKVMIIKYKNLEIGKIKVKGLCS